MSTILIKNGTLIDGSGSKRYCRAFSGSRRSLEYHYLNNKTSENLRFFAVATN